MPARLAPDSPDQQRERQPDEQDDAQPVQPDAPAPVRDGQHQTHPHVYLQNARQAGLY